jgi:galactofuranosylgalactofuranosylrhamnosyl-N-acetylglucosaminyl-diphospho-decaprenol beta-1,5/1,6-galactofuranosyltransferase
MYEFQKIYNPTRPQIRNLFISTKHGAYELDPCPREDSGGHASLYRFTPDEAVQFGGFFNSVYEDEIRTITGLATLTLNINLRGTFDLYIYRAHDFTASPIVTCSIDTEGEMLNWQNQVELLSGKGSRLYFELTSKSENAVLQSATWDTHEQPKNEVKLCIVTTTFKNEYLTNRNISYLLESEEIKKYNVELAVVDNASSFQPEIKDDRLHLIQQSNVGGAGGFTRGIYEVVHGKLSDQGFTHILLMDDDIRLHHSSIVKTMKMQQYGQDKAAFGGCMLDLNRPQFLFEAGAFSCRKKPIGNHNDTIYSSANDPTNLDSIGKPTDYDYCGWWFFSFPIGAVQEIGLPKALFIRGDDVDYGARLQHAGFKNYCLGGVGVWHLHFLEKPISWVVYFIFRNHLILLATSHQDRGWGIGDITQFLRTSIFYNLCQYDYAHAALILMAIEDFLKGPEFIKNSNAEELLKKAIATYSHYHSSLDPEETMLKYGIKEIKKNPSKPLINYIKKITLNYQKTPFKKQTNTEFIILHKDSPPSWKQVPEQNGYVLVDGIRDVKRVYERRPALAVELDLKARDVMTRFEKEYPTIAQQFEKNSHHMHSKEYWEEYLKANGCMSSHSQ